MLWLKGCGVVLLIIIIAMFKFGYQGRVIATIGVISLMLLFFLKKKR